MANKRGRYFEDVAGNIQRQLPKNMVPNDQLEGKTLR